MMTMQCAVGGSLTLSVTDSTSVLNRTFSVSSSECMRHSAQIDSPTFPLSCRARVLWRSFPAVLQDLHTASVAA